MSIELFFLVAVLLIATYLLMPGPPNMNASPTSLEDFQVPDNSSFKVVPRVYGTVYLKGNYIYYGNLNSSAIKQCT